MKDILITVISVSFNCENMVNKTIESLASQTYKDFEYLVVDGKSLDKTVEKIEEYHSLFKNMRVISEKDSGIYDAMNKGVSNARGKYIFFLNFGDCLHDEDVLINMAKKMKSNADVYYGDIEKNDTEIIQKNKATLFNCIYREYMICHQSIFSKRDLLLKYPFDLGFRLCADRDWLIKVLYDDYKIEYCNYLICRYDTTGISSNPVDFMKESELVSAKYGGICAKIFIKIKRKMGKTIRKACKAK